MRRHDRDERRPKGAGFTLVELLVVIAIIGLIISLILVAAADGVRRAEERATQSLITKIETGLNDRLDALENSQAPINQAHRYLAAINFSPDGTNYIPVGATTGSGSDERRAQVMAQFDYLRSELPDVFFVQGNTSDGGTLATSYPLNFAAAPYPPGNNNLYNYVVPLGVGYDVLGNLGGGILEATTSAPLSDTTKLPVTGMFGASFSAAGGIYKNLYAAAAADLAAAGSATVVNGPLAYDGVDNNGNGYVDELTEASTASDFLTAVTARLGSHTHKTARSEMLYAILVEGLGPLGSVFNREDFTPREVQDTDGDGLPEFIDAWGEPLQFYRWPIYFGDVAGSSDSQKGSAFYNGYTETRQLDALDPNQLLVNPGWWALAGNPSLSTPTTNPFAPPNGTTNASQGAMAFMHYFHSLIDPKLSVAAGAPWDRTGNYDRRAYYSRFLVISGGPDKEPGVAGFGRDYSSNTNGGASFPFPNTSFLPSTAYTVEQTARYLILIENQASQSEPNFDTSISSYVRTGSFYETPRLDSPTTIYLESIVGVDDISNHNIQAPGTGVR